MNSRELTPKDYAYMLKIKDLYSYLKKERPDGTVEEYLMAMLGYLAVELDNRIDECAKELARVSAMQVLEVN